MSTSDPASTPDLLTPERVEMVRNHLKEITDSEAFKGSKRAQDFLHLIIEHTLAGRLDNLRERMIGAEMFGRPIDYDTANDAVVRVKASEVRRKLAQFYRETPSTHSITIELPTGSYVPKFHWAGQQNVSQAPAVPPVEASASSPGTVAEEIPGEAEQVQEEAPPPLPQSKSSWQRWLPAAGAAAVILGILTYISLNAPWGRKASPSAQQPETTHSIAILPLENLSGDPKQEYLADGLTEELIAEMGQVSALRVISRTSVMAYKGTKKTIPQIAQELGVEDIVEGSILREGHRIRVTAQLIDAKTDRHLWAHSYERDLNSILDLQGQVAQAIAEEISINLTPQEQARLTRVRSSNEEAQEYYLQGLHMMNSGDPKQAIDYLQISIDHDAKFAAAHALLSDAYGWMGGAGWTPYSEAFPKEKEEALKAIALDDSLSDGHVQLAEAVMNLAWDWTTADREFRRALELNPSSSSALWNYANHQQRQGKTEQAVALAQAALQRDPTSSRAFMKSAFMDYYNRKYDQALIHIQRSQDLKPNPAEVIFPLAIIYIEKGMYADGIRELQKVGDKPHALGHMANAYARMGQPDEAKALIERLKTHVAKTGIGRYEIAIAYAGLGDKDSAFQWLEQAYETRDKGLLFLRIDPCLDPLRSDPRFTDLLKRVGL